jgi:DNA-directed RNA polymerase subunit RPC12/RpoP
MEQLVKNAKPEAEWLLAPHESIPAKRFLCSNCRNEFETKHYTDKCYYNFCPNCGFKMR